MEGKIITVWGSPNSGKTTFATKLATAIYTSFESTVITLFTDIETPVLPVLFPFGKTEELGSVGVPLSKTEVEQGDIINNLVTVKEMQNFGFLGYRTGENKFSYPKYGKAKAEALSHKWSTQNDALLAQYSADLHASFQETRTQLEARKADLSRLHSTLAGDDAQTRRLAQEQLDTARIAIQSFEVEFGRSPAAEDYHRAVEYFNGGLYENAHSLASAVALDVYTQLEKALVQQAKDDFLRTAIHTMVRTGQARIHALENCTVPYQGVEYNEDLTRFVPDVFAALKTCLQQQEHALESASSAELAKARADVSELLQDVDCATRTAARQMIYAYSENDSGELVQSAMFQQGYTCTGYAYKHRLEGQPLHINFEKALTGEKVTVELIPDDHGVALNVHNFGRQAGTPMSAHAQDTLRNNLVAALNQSGALRVPCHASCSNSGVSSSAAQAADLHAVSQ